MSPASMFWVGFGTGFGAAASLACFIAAALNVRRSREASRYVRQRYS
jgi:hypothetical protein